ncbi:hypothetical protein PO124_09765 [Bacillus licheniformis]|nr:hypothetical protein [Bacillus licheniformis]
MELINETSHQLNRTKRLPDMMKSLSERLISSFGAEEVGFFIKSLRQGNPAAGKH